MYQNGHGVKNDYNKASIYFKKAIERSNTNDQYCLEYPSEEEDDIGLNIKKHIEWHSNPVDQNNIGANYSLEVEDDDGQGAKKGYNALFENYKDVARSIYPKNYDSETDYNKEINDEIIYLKKANFNPGTIFDKSHRTEEYYKSIISYYDKVAQRGLSFAQFKLGYFYYRGFGVKQDQKKSIEWYEKAISQNHILAAYNLGVMYEHGETFKKDLNLALDYYMIAAKQGYSQAQFQVGLLHQQIYKGEESLESSIEWYKKAADQGHIIAMYKLGDIYWNNQNDGSNRKTALGYYRKGADQGYAYAEFQLANLYHRGYGVEVNDIKAREWYIKAIYKNIVESRYKMGNIKADRQKFDEFDEQEANEPSEEKSDESDEFNDEKSNEFKDVNSVESTKGKTNKWNKSNSNECDDEKKTEEPNKNIINQSNEQKIDGSDEEKTQKIIKKILQNHNEAAENGDINSQIKLGLLFHHGLSDGKDFSATLKLLEKAANKNPEVYSLLGDMYLCNENSSQDFSKIRMYYKNVPEGRNKSAALRGIGLLYEHGDGVEQNLEKAFEHYKISADLNNKAACYNIALFYYKGISVRKNYLQAFHWFNLVIQNGLNENATHIFIQDTDDLITSNTFVKKKRYTLVSENTILGEAHYYIGKMYESGQGITKNNRIAAVHFEEAANYGSENGMNHFKNII